ncbi:MAG TPA: zinc ribbon domain-containing protein [Gemmatimonadaceae bacterium]
MSDMLAGVVVALAAMGYVLQPLLKSGRGAHRRVVAGNATQPECSQCGARPEPDAEFCSSCGRALRNG